MNDLAKGYMDTVVAPVNDAITKKMFGTNLNEAWDDPIKAAKNVEDKINSVGKALGDLKDLIANKFSKDKPAPQADKPAPQADNPAPQADNPAPQADTPAPQADNPAPQADNPAPQADNSDPKPTVDKPQAEEEETIGLAGIPEVDKEMGQQEEETIGLAGIPEVDQEMGQQMSALPPTDGVKPDLGTSTSVLPTQSDGVGVEPPAPEVDDDLSSSVSNTM
jgi:hypothetical protein